MLAGLGVVGFILGFAMQDSLSNFASGLMILFYRPYDVGDLVEISGAFGKVEHMSMVSTSILTLDNQKLVVPNSKIWGDVIKNVTDQHTRRVDMTFGISYSDDIPLAEEVLNKILAECEGVLDQPEPMVRLHTLGESSVDFIVRPWVRTEDYWDVYWAVTREVKMRFDAEQDQHSPSLSGMCTCTRRPRRGRPDMALPSRGPAAGLPDAGEHAHGTPNRG